MDTLSNRIVRTYHIREQIGSGGQGAVYKAYQPAIERDVAIKIILPQYASQPDFIRRFEVEAQLIARLAHPHIVPLYDYWRDPEGAYLVMRWLPSNLKASIGRSVWKLEAAAQLLDQLAAALSAAHREGIVHRDIKPANILLDEDENVYLADFGIAHNLHLRAQGNIADEEVLGSPEYITPEVLRNQEITTRTDLYSLGYVMYEVLTGQKPFPGATTPSDYIKQHLNTPMPLISIQNSNIPAALDEVLQTATAKDPLQRYASVQRFAAAFRAAIPPHFSRMPAQPLADPLTERELDVLKHMIEGLDNSQIAAKLFLTPGTVKWYVKQIYSKLDAHNRQQAVEKARNLHLIDRPLFSPPAVSIKETGETVRVSVPPLLEPENPYKGLQAFQESDSQHFFGRAALTERLLSRLSENGDNGRFLVVVGPSGSGKSSVVRAGLIPALRRGALHVSPRPLIIDMLPGTHPFEELEDALLRVAASPQPDLTEHLREDRRGLVRAAKRILPNDPDTELILVIDQFEELFTLVEDDAIRTHFIDNLLSAVTDPRGRIRVILTLRADFYDRPLMIPRLAELMRSSTETVIPLNARELEQAIIAPAERVGVRLETGLATTIINDVGEQPGTLPLLQFAMTELFERREGQVLSLDAYRKIGGVTGALARSAIDVYTSLDEAAQGAAQQLFLRLITLGEGTEDTRRRVLLSELLAIVDDSRQMEEVIDAFTQHRLLTLDRDLVTRAPTVEIAHEALIREWGRLREWLANAREEIRLQRQLNTAAKDWHNARQDDSFLLRGARLDIFSGWAIDTTLAMTPHERNYLSASSAAHEREQQAEAERQAQETRLQRRSQTFLRGLVIVMGMAVVIASLLSLAAIGERNRADAALVGEQEARTVIEENVLSLRELALVNGAQAAYASNDLDTARALSLVANMGENPSSQSQRLLADAAYAPGTLSVIGDDRYLYDWNAATLSPDGRTLITMSYSENRELVVWDLVSGKVTGIFPTTPNEPLSSIAFRPTTEAQDWQLLTSSENGTMTLWDYTRQQPLRTFEGESFVWAVVFSPDGEYLASGYDDGSLRLWDADSGDLLQTLNNHVMPIMALSFSPDGARLLSASQDGIVMLWDTATGQMLDQFDSGLQPSGLIFSPDANRFLVSSFSPFSMSLWDIETHREVRTFRRVGPISSPYFSLDGQTVFATEGNFITFWDINTGEVARLLTGHRHAVSAIFPNADASRLLSVSRDGTIRQWDLHNGAEIVQTQSLFPFLLMDGAISPDARLFAIGAGGSTVRRELPGLVLLYDAVTGAEIRRFGFDGVAHTTSTSSVRFSPDGETILSADWSGEIKLWDATNGLLAWEVQGISSPVNSVEFTPEGSAIIASTDEGDVVWIDSSTGEITRRYSLDAPVKNAIFTHDATRFLACLADPSSSIVLVDVESGETLLRFTGPSSVCLALAVSPDNLTAVSGHFDGSMFLWDLTSGQQIRRFTGGLGQIAEILFSNDGQTLYVGSFPGAAHLLTLSVWDVAADEPYRRYTGSPNPIDALDLSADGRTLLAGSYNGIARLWRVDDLAQLIDWTRANRYVPELTCTQRTLYRLDPLCDADAVGN